MKEKESEKNKISDPEMWVELYGDYLYRYAFMRLSDRVVSEDVVQETFLAALKARHNFAGQSSEKTWFVGILKRKIVDHFRKTGRMDTTDDITKYVQGKDKEFLISGIKPGNWKTGQRPAEWMIDTADSVEINEFWEFLKACLAELPRRFAEAFILREMEELETEELSNVLEIKPTNLRVLLFRARKQLRRCLEINWIGINNKTK